MNILIGYLKRYWKLVVLALGLATVNQCFSLLDPYIFGRIVDKYAMHTKELALSAFISGVGVLLLLSMSAAFMSRVAKNFQDYYVNVITQRLGAQIYADGVRHSLELPYQVFEDQRSGETLGKLQKVRQDVMMLVSQFVNVLYLVAIGLIFVIIYSISVYWVIGLVYFLIAPIIGILSYTLSKRIKTIQRVIVAQTTALAGATTESLRNIELVKSLGLAQQEIERLNTTNGKILELELKKVRYVRKLSFLQGTMINALRTTILFLMMYLIYIHQITFGQFFSLWIYSFFIFGPLQELGNLINTYREAEASLINFQTILDMPKEATPLNPVPLGHVLELEFDHVTFQHLTASTKALVDISFSMHRGETIAFVGPSGAGKTTLVKLLVGLYHPMEGEVRYNKQSSKNVDLEELRERIGFVTQDTQLFSGTIRENLLFVNPSATDEECMEMLNKAACQSLLARAHDGLDTTIGEGGVKVSGGEKQRLSIARALLRHPDILVFDEATSSLDSLTEEEITDTIRSVSSGTDMLSILIAHRLSTVMHADRIYVLERGHIIESGKHDELLDIKGLYYAMWRQQIGERSRMTTVRTLAGAMQRTN